MFDSREKIKNFLIHPFVKDTFLLQINTIFASGLGILVSVIIARLLQPEKFGLYGLVFAFAGLLGLFMNWGAEKTTVTLFSEAYARRDKEEIKNILIYFLKINFLIFSTLGLLAILLAPFLSQIFYKSFEIGALARLIIFTNILSILSGIFTITLQVLRQMGYYILIDIFNSFLKSGLAIILVVLGLGVFGVVLGYLLAAIFMLVMAVLFYSFLVKSVDFLPTWANLWRGIWRVPIKKYFKFGFLLSLDENLGGFYRYLPIVFLGMFIAIESIGYLKVALNYISLPLLLLGPIAQLLNIQLPATKTFGRDALKRNFIKVTVYSFILAAGLTLILVLLAPFLIRFFYGDSYLSSVTLVYYLAIFAALSSLGVGVGSMFRTLNLVGAALKINIFIIILGLPLVFLFVKFYGVWGAAFSAIIWPLISDAISWIYLFRRLEKYEKTPTNAR